MSMLLDLQELFLALRIHNQFKDEVSKAADVNGRLSVLAGLSSTPPAIKRGLNLFIQKERLRHEKRHASNR